MIDEKILSVLKEKYGLKEAGKNYFCHCPFHNEITPSFCINPRYGKYVCYGCGERGDVEDLLTKIEEKS